MANSHALGCYFLKNYICMRDLGQVNLMGKVINVKNTNVDKVFGHRY